MITVMFSSQLYQTSIIHDGDRRLLNHTLFAIVLQYTADHNLRGIYTNIYAPNVFLVKTFD